MKMNRILIASAALFVSAVSCLAQTALAQTAARREVSFDQVRAAARTTLRDSAEFPLRLEIAVTARDKTGKVLNQKNGKVNYNFHGYNPHSGKGNFDMRGPRSMFGSAINSFFAITMLGSVLLDDAEKAYSVQIADDRASPALISARLTQKGCGPLIWSEKHQAVESVCGMSELHLRRQDLTLDHYDYEDDGVPAQAVVKPFGKTTIVKCHVSYDFQSVLIPGDPKPYLLPQHMNTTIETDKGTLQISTIVSQRK